MNSEDDNKEFEIVMGGETDFDISEVGDSINTLNPNTSEKRKNIIIPVSKKKEQNSDDEEDKEEENKKADSKHESNSEAK